MSSGNQYLTGNEVEQIQSDEVLTVADVIKFREGNES